jgi:hypothetical protein
MMNNEDAESYSLSEPFDIQDGEMDGLSVDYVFALAVEWSWFRDQLLAGEAFARQVHAPNVRRLKAMCARHGRAVTDHWLHEDYPEWRVLKVAEQC